MCLGSYLRGCLDQLVSLLPAAVSCKMEGSSGRAKEPERALGEKILEEQALRWEDLFFLSALVLRGDLFPKKWV